jgi:hypothetical protein
MTRAFAATAFVLSCAAPAPAPRHESAVVNGFEPAGAEATVTLGFYVFGFFRSTCSGSLVAPNVVLTAKHCIPDWVDCDSRGLAVGFGREGLDGQLRVRETVCSENSCTGRDCPPNWNFAYEDIALLVLEEPLDDDGAIDLEHVVYSIPPYGIPWAGDGIAEGDVVRLIGYGRTEEGTNGLRLATDDEVVSIYDDEFQTRGNGVCPGDSGGTALDDSGVVVGINVRGIDDGCVVPPPERLTFLTRVEHWLDVVEEAFSRAGRCTPISEEECNGRDDDCDEEIDEGCGYEGDPCDVLRPGESCASGFYCRETGCGQGVCTAGEAGEAKLGDPCAGDLDCATLRCADTGGGSRCTRPCEPGAGACGIGEVCEGTDPVCAVCVDASAAGAGVRGLGEPCARDGDCLDGACVHGLEGRFCTRACAAEPACPAGWHCAGETCRRGDPAGVGAPCGVDGACASRLCAHWDDASSCSAECGDGLPCPPGASCEAGLCRPDDSVTGQACAGNDDCVSNLCGSFSSGHRCTEYCDPWDPCPDGFACVGAAGGAHICARPATEALGGACAVGGDPQGLACAAVVLLALARRRGP